MFAIETTSLSFSYRKNQAVFEHLHLKVPEHSIYGFLGPNGAGKTTLMRILLGLIRGYSGEVNIAGTTLKSNPYELYRKIGSLIEQPSLYLHLSARENLEIYRHLFGCPKQNIEDVLQLVKLKNAGQKNVRQFSLGMKQRLGIAIALLHEPEILFLDEPINGLDPEGILETRELINHLNKSRGTSIFISSHLLSELEKTVSHFGILHQGKLKFQGTLTEFENQNQAQNELWIHVNDPQKAKSILDENCETEQRDLWLCMSLPDDRTIAQLINKLQENHLEIYEVRKQKKDLESMFLELMQNPQ
jgi:ABC-2 type transport system ATP-binding protein